MRSPRPYEWGALLRANVRANLELVGWLLRGAPGPWWQR